MRQKRKKTGNEEQTTRKRNNHEQETRSRKKKQRTSQKQSNSNAHKQISSACLTRAPCQFNYAPQLSSTQWQIGSHGRSTGGSSAPQLSSTGWSAPPMLSPFPSLLSCAWCVGAWHAGSNLECLGFSRSPKETDQVSAHCSNCCSVILSSEAQIRIVHMHQRLASICGGREYHILQIVYS